MKRSTRRWKSVFGILCALLVVFVYNAFTEERLSLSEKAFYERAELSARTLRDEENHDILDYVRSSSSLPKILPKRRVSDNEILQQKGREYVTVGQGPAPTATLLANHSFSGFNTNPFGSFRLSFNVVQRK